MAFVTPAHAAKKPDLVIAAARIQGHPYTFKGEPQAGFLTSDTTRNVGSAAAGPSSTRAYLVHDATQPLLASRGVPRLRAGRQSAGDAQDSGGGHNYPIGAYLVKVCADANRQVAESNESNNCAYVRNPVLETIKVFVLRKVWYGTIDGGGHVGGLFETYRSDNATLVFNKPVAGAPGVFTYDFVGPVSYTASGTAGICTYSGTGSTSVHDEQAAAFDYLHGRYQAGASTTGAFYSITQKCGPFTSHFPGPYSPNFLVTGPKGFPFGADRIAGHYQSPAQIWGWSFGASAGGGD